MRTGLWLIAATAGCSDASLKTVNSAPSALITSHVDGDRVTADTPFTLVGAVSDADDALDELQVTWLDGSEPLCPESTAGSDGLTTCEIALPAGEIRITLMVRDPGDVAGVDQVDLIVEATAPDPPPSDDTGDPPPSDDTGDPPPPDDTGEPPDNAAPTCTITAPGDGVTVPAETTLDFAGTVSDDTDAATDLEIAWTSDLDGPFGVAPAEADGTVRATGAALSVGHHTVTLSATDADGATCSEAITLDINGQPTAPEVVIDPGPAFTDDDLTAVLTTPSTDPEGDAISYSFAWTVDGTPVSITDTTVPASETIRGEIWRVIVTPSDALGAGGTGEATREIVNTPPQVDAITLSPDPATTTNTLIATIAVSDADSDPVSSSYTWSVNGLVIAETGSTLSGATYFDKHDEVVVTATPSDSTADGDPLSSDPLVIDNTPPEAPGIAIEPEDPEPGIDHLECIIETESFDADDDEVTYTTEWDVDGTSWTGPFGVSDLIELWRSDETPRTGAGYGIDWGDYDGDGDLDLAVANVYEGNQVYRNDGAEFTLVWTSPESDTSMSAGWADWNDDGDLDIAFGGYWGAPTRVYQGDGSTFALAWTDSGGGQVWDLDWGDLNGDDLPDLALANELGENRVYANTGGGLDLAWSSSDTAGTLGIAWGDWDGDGDDDLAVGNQKSCGSCGSGHPNQVYDNDGGSLSLAWTSPESDGTYTLDWADWDGDGDLDLAVGGSSGPTIRVYENTGGDLSSTLEVSTDGAAASVDWGDWDGDGDPDLVSNDDGDVILWDNDGGTLTEIWSMAGGSWGAVAWGDMDGDGDPDLALGSDGGISTVVLENDRCEDCVPGESTGPGETWTCTVTPDDGEDEGTAATTSVTMPVEPVYRWVHTGTESMEMVYGICGHTESYSATCEEALLDERVFINESGGAALERKAIGESHLGTEPGARGHTVWLSGDELDITWSGATSCGGDWVQTDTVDVYICTAE